MNLNAGYALSPRLYVHQMFQQAGLRQFSDSAALLKVFYRNLHGKKPVGKTAKRFPVKEISPSSHDLPHQQRHGHRIQHQCRFLFSHPGKYQKNQHCRHHPADNTHSAMSGIYNLRRIILIIIPGKNHIIHPGTDNCRYHHPQQVIQIQFGILSCSLCFLLGNQQSGQKAGSNDDPIIHNLKISNGYCPANIGQHHPQMGKPYIRILHICLLNLCIFSTEFPLRFSFSFPIVLFFSPLAYPQIPQPAFLSFSASLFFSDLHPVLVRIIPGML